MRKLVHLHTQITTVFGVDGRWWRESVRDEHFAAAEAEQLDPHAYLKEQP